MAQASFRLAFCSPFQTTNDTQDELVQFLLIEVAHLGPDLLEGDLAVYETHPTHGYMKCQP